MNLTKQISQGLVAQLRDLWKLLFLIYLPISLLFIGVGILSRAVDHVSLAFFLRDIVATGRLPFFAGFVAQLGGVLWSASLTVCLFSLLLLPQKDSRLISARRFLLHASVLTVVLLLDDNFSFPRRDRARIPSSPRAIGNCFVSDPWDCFCRFKLEGNAQQRIPHSGSFAGSVRRLDRSRCASHRGFQCPLFLGTT